MIKTLAQMPAVAGLKQKPFIGKADRAKSFSRRTWALAVCVGLLLLEPVDCVKGGILAEFGIELLQHVTIQAIESGVNDGLNQINKVDGGYGTGTLMGILGGNTTDVQLAKISSQITVAQNMITSLQGDLDVFENQVTSDLNFIAMQNANEQYSQLIKTATAD